MYRIEGRRISLVTEKRVNWSIEKYVPRCIYELFITYLRDKKIISIQNFNNRIK